VLSTTVSLLITISFGIDLALLVKTNSLILHFHRAKQFSYLFTIRLSNHFIKTGINAPSPHHPSEITIQMYSFFKDFNDWALSGVIFNVF
jgi:hypothetical protein